ncbi:TetR family transcriptional regulator C-terminal domain-containing protein [Streptomyces bambusae]|uniref:TetR/AcrR family transcriptional regulator n=1 Tax=Streptomyces bambusae TaxID=1550616 RepID=UPI001CFC6BA5|nr:TetR family transcriptional regulator C-terminal domain-containing protein [Streptomyces bambusae]MCB5163963.1 TetR family transcriptional regulator C-terminal domain-containing protein [Streptomyces bambusae]
MARTKGDHEARRRDVSEAVWRVLSAHGFGGLTMRAVAAELGATTGLLTHYFATKRDLVAYALDLLDRRTAEGRRPYEGEGLAALRAALRDALPLTAEATTSNRIWVSSWDTALADPALGADHAARYATGRDRLTTLVAAAQLHGDLPPGDPADIATAAQSFTLGLTIQALLAPTAFPPSRQTRLLDDYVASLTTG